MVTRLVASPKSGWTLQTLLLYRERSDTLDSLAIDPVRSQGRVTRPETRGVLNAEGPLASYLFGLPHLLHYRLVGEPHCS